MFVANIVVLIDFLVCCGVAGHMFVPAVCVLPPSCPVKV